MFRIILILFILTSYPVQAYMGPGMAGGLIATTIGIVVAIFAALFGILYFPIKRFLKNKKQKKTNEKE